MSEVMGFLADHESAIGVVFMLLLFCSVGAAALFAQSVPKTQLAFSTANTNRDGTGTLGTLATGTSGGCTTSATFIITCQTAAPVEDILRLYSYNGSTYKLIREYKIQPNSSSGVAAVGWQTELVIPQLSRDLATTSDVLKIGTHIGNSYQCETALTKWA